MRALTARLHPALPVSRRLLRLRSDAMLGERFAAGDEDAFTILYERHRATVLAVSIGVLGSRHDAEDAVQDCFAALATTLRAHPPREVRPWLIRVARNAAIDVARRRRSAEVTGEEALERAAPPPTDPAELRSVLDGIRELPESQRTALLMRELAGHTYREIATYLDTEEDAVRGLIARARIGLRDHREASELPCEQARDAIAIDPYNRPRDRTLRRHVAGCTGCQAYERMLRDDAKALRGLMPVSGGGLAAGGAIAGGLGAKGALLGAALTQAGAACAVSVCAVGGMALIAPRVPVFGTTTVGPSTAHHAGTPASGHARRSTRTASSTPASSTPTSIRSSAAADRTTGAPSGHSHSESGFGSVTGYHGHDGAQQPTTRGDGSGATGPGPNGAEPPRSATGADAGYGSGSTQPSQMHPLIPPRGDIVRAWHAPRPSAS